jgi:hypothetical protein
VDTYFAKIYSYCMTMVAKLSFTGGSTLQPSQPQLFNIFQLLPAFKVCSEHVISSFQGKVFPCYFIFLVLRETSVTSESEAYIHIEKSRAPFYRIVGSRDNIILQCSSFHRGKPPNAGFLLWPFDSGAAFPSCRPELVSFSALPQSNASVNEGHVLPP